MFKTIFLLVPAALMVMSCGTIFNGTTQNIFVNASPNAVNVAVSGGDRKFITPTILSLERKGNYLLTFSKEGYEERQIEIKRTISVNILVLSILTIAPGILVDAFTGGLYILKPESVSVGLANLGSVDGPDNIELVLKGNNEGMEVKSSVDGVTITVEKTE